MEVGVFLDQLAGGFPEQLDAATGLPDGGQGGSQVPRSLGLIQNAKRPPLKVLELIEQIGPVFYRLGLHRPDQGLREMVLFVAIYGAGACFVTLRYASIGATVEEGLVYGVSGGVDANSAGACHPISVELLALAATNLCGLLLVISTRPCKTLISCGVLRHPRGGYQIDPAPSRISARNHDTEV